MQPTHPIEHHGGTLSLAVMYFLGACVLLAIIAWPGYSSYLDAREQAGITAQQSKLQLIKERIDREFFEVAANTLLLSEQQLVKDALLPGAATSEAATEQLAEHFLRMAYTLQRYDQLSLLNARGHEQVRVHYRNGLALQSVDSQLGDHSMQPYFKTVKTLKRGHIFVAPLDLNEKNGIVERPFVPVVRFVAPVLDADSQLMGAIVLSYQVQSIISAVQDLFADESPHVNVALLNEEGYWLTSNQAEQNWGWKIGRSDLTLKRRQPQLWQALMRTPMGVLTNSQGVDVFRGLYPLETIALTGAEVVTVPWPATSPTYVTSDITAMRWTVLVSIASGLWLEGTLLNERWVQIVLLGLLLTFAVGSWALARQHTLRRAMRALKDETAQELEAIYEHAPCAYQSIDKNGIIIRMNKTGLEWVGYERDQIINKAHYQQIFEPEPQANHYHHGQTPTQILKEHGSLVDYPMRMRRQDGSTFPVSVSAVAVFDDNGRYIMTRTTVVNVTERRRLEEDLRHQAHTDALTGAVNRRHFLDLARAELERVQHGKTECALLMLDLDHFKSINDTYGHAVGDQALVLFTQLCRKCMRSNDILARTGGEEFAALLPGTPLKAATMVADRICQAVQSHAMALSDGKNLCFTVSIGVSELKPVDTSPDAAFSRADELLYKAKNQGRNRVVCAA